MSPETASYCTAQVILKFFPPQIRLYFVPCLALWLLDVVFPFKICPLLPLHLMKVTIF